MIPNTKDVGAGAIFIVLGGAFAVGSLNLDLGNPLRMGPGLFPLILSGLMVALGLAILILGTRHPPAGAITVPWRGLVLILVAPVLFGLTVRGLGLAPAIVLVALTSALASRRTRPWMAVAVTAGLTVFCILVFSYGLGLPVRLVGPWLGAS